MCLGNAVFLIFGVKVHTCLVQVSSPKCVCVCVCGPEVNILFHHCSATCWCKPAPPHPALTSVLGIEPWSSCFYSKHYPLSHLLASLSFLTSRKLQDQQEGLCVPLSKFTGCFHVHRRTGPCVVWQVHCISSEGMKALKCIESEKWS